MDKIQFFTQAIQDELSKKNIALPIPSGVAVNLNELLGKEDISYSDISRIAEKDPSLTAKLLNLANSSYYSGIVRTTTIEQAVSRIGITGVKNLLMTIIFKDVFVCKDDYLLKEFEINWQHSLACGLCAQKIAEKVHMSFMAQDAYMLGLLHDIGVVVILDVLCTLYKRGDELRLNSRELLEIIYSLHPTAGAMVLGQLKFNEKICRMVEMHHAPESYCPRDETLFNILLTADALLKKAGLSLKPNPDISMSDLPAALVLNADSGFIAVLEADIHSLSADMDKLI
ncbi:MAG: HDOD domain-containing protein [Pseudomonadota bacterium]